MTDFAHHRKSIVPKLIVLLLGIGCISTASVLIRLTLGEGTHPFAVAAGRLWVAFLILAPYSITFRGKEFLQLSKRDFWLSIAAGAILGIHFGAWVFSLQSTSIASSVVLVTTSPLWVAIVSSILLKEKPSPTLIGALALGLVGMTVIGWNDASVMAGSPGPAAGIPPTGTGILAADGLALTGAFAAAAYFLLGRIVRPHLSVTVYATLVYGAAAVLLTLAWWVSGGGTIPLTGTALAWILLLGLIPQLAGHTIFNWALADFPATVVSLAVLGNRLARSFWPPGCSTNRPASCSPPVASSSSLPCSSPREARNMPRPRWKNRNDRELHFLKICVYWKRTGGRMSFSWRCQYCSWQFQMSSDAVSAALATADADQARHHVEHCPRCRKALKIPVDQLRRHVPASLPAVSTAPIRASSNKEEGKTMIETPAPIPPVETPAPVAPPPVAPAAPAVAAPAAPKPAAKKPALKKPAKKAAKKPAKKVAKKPVKKAVKKPAKKKVVKKVVKKTAKKAAKKGKKK